MEFLVIVYGLQSLFLFFGLLKGNRRSPSPSAFPSISVVVAARNEAKNMMSCLTSLARLDYPPGKLEIIVVNDRSTDGTGQLIRKFADEHPSFTSMDISAVDGSLTGKSNALAQAIGLSSGELIFITDADCTVPASWLRKTIPYFSQETGIVAGFSILSGRSFFSLIQSLDLFYLLSVAAGAAHWGIPLSCIGNNFAFRREAYDAVGGYRGIEFSLAEDFALLRAISDRTQWKTVFAMDSGCLVHSVPIRTVKDFLDQRKRWAIGGMQVRCYGKFLIGLSILTTLSILIHSVVFKEIMLSLAALGAIVLVDGLLLLFTVKKFYHGRILRYYPAYKIFFCCYSILLSVMIAFTKRVVWKDIIYTQK